MSLAVKLIIKCWPKCSKNSFLILWFFYCNAKVKQFIFLNKVALTLSNNWGAANDIGNSLVYFNQDKMQPAPLTRKPLVRTCSESCHLNLSAAVCAIKTKSWSRRSGHCWTAAKKAIAIYRLEKLRLPDFSFKMR